MAMQWMRTMGTLAALATLAGAWGARAARAQDDGATEVTVRGPRASRRATTRCGGRWRRGRAW